MEQIAGKKKHNLSLELSVFETASDFLIFSCWKSNTAQKEELLSACDSTIRKTCK